MDFYSLWFRSQVDGAGVAPNLTPDQDIFLHLASQYVDRHKTMKNITKCFRFDWQESNITL